MSSAGVRPSPAWMMVVNDPRPQDPPLRKMSVFASRSWRVLVINPPAYPRGTDVGAAAFGGFRPVRSGVPAAELDARGELA